MTTPEHEKSSSCVEGHVRLTAYALFPDHVPEELEILLGVSEDMPNWCLF